MRKDVNIDGTSTSSPITVGCLSQRFQKIHTQKGGKNNLKKKQYS
jgi:hypothetical protein